jgi:hypothetical protein
VSRLAPILLACERVYHKRSGRCGVRSRAHWFQVVSFLGQNYLPIDETRLQALPMTPGYGFVATKGHTSNARGVPELALKITRSLHHIRRPRHEPRALHLGIMQARRTGSDLPEGSSSVFRIHVASSQATRVRLKTGGFVLKLRALHVARLLICLSFLLATAGLASARAASVANLAPQLHVSGNRLVNAYGKRVVLHGVDRSGTEYECVQGRGIFDGPNTQASITAMQKWDINAVRVPLNEACWNGQAYVERAYRGDAYRRAIEAYVRLLNANGMVAILDLHWSDGLYTGPFSGCASAEAVCQKPMPDAAESIRFWSSVAATFAGNEAVIFDLFNEPYPDRALPTETAAWKCWLHGGAACSPGISYRVAGMQTLVTAVRATGANNVIMVGGLMYANNLSEWLRYEPVDPDHNLAASWHSYSFNICVIQSCWTNQISPVIAKVPVIAGEIGENDCADHYIDRLMAYLDSESTSYVAWAWNADFPCADGLITNYRGAPSAYGAGYRSHLLSLAGS